MVIPADLAAFLRSRAPKSSKPAPTPVKSVQINGGGRNPAQQRSGAPASAGTSRPVAPSLAPEPVRTVQIGGGGRAPNQTLEQYRAEKAATQPASSPSSPPPPAPPPSPPPSDSAPASAPAATPADTTNPLQGEVDALRQELADFQQRLQDDRRAGVYRELESYLQAIGLGSLMQTDSNGNPTGWLWEQVKSGVTSSASLEIALRQTPEFQQRFGIILEQQRRAAAGENVYVMTPAEVLAYEVDVSQAFRTAGLPTSFYDTPGELHQYLSNNLSGEDVVGRIETAFNYVVTAPPEVRAKFEEFYGVGQGDIALATYILDPDIAVRELEKAGRTAYAAGVAERYDIQLARQQAERIAETPLTNVGISEGLQQIAAQAPLFAESVGEAVDLTAEETGVAAVFEGSGEARTALERRLAQRQAVNRATVGGAITTSAGVVGLGIGN